MVAWVDSRWLSIAIVLLGTAYFLYNLFISNPQLLTLPSLGLLVIFFIGALPLQYVLAFVFLRVALLQIFVNRLFLLFNIRVKPLHPDGSGGLAALSRILWISAVSLFVFALILFAIFGHITAPISPLEIITVTITYLTLITVHAIGWLALPHRAMLQARNEHLQPIMEEYERVLLETRPATDEETAQIMAGTERLSALKQRYELVRDTFPTWPIQLVELSRLAGALLLPVLIALLPALISVFTRK
jgi:hypothetical protein